MAPRSPSARTLRTYARRSSMQNQICELAEALAGPRPTITQRQYCAVRIKLCYGRGEDFDNIGRYTRVCVSRDNRSLGLSCATAHMLTPKLPEWQLRMLRELWAEYDLLGKKWGKANVPGELHLFAAAATAPRPVLPSFSRRTATMAAPRAGAQASTSASASTAPVTTTRKRPRSPSVSLSSSAKKKRKIGWIDVDEIDISD
ncbi:hypothetical protein C8J57DRAFT_1516797 [Mycena rebaudengoi]|nr:hypothetical protein C8J57DRAFT_1516797 [Mycena rebaudengoi]